MSFAALLDTASLDRLVHLAGFAVLLDPEIQAALTQAGKQITEAAQANTWQVFDNPSGALASSIYPWMASSEELQIVVGVPYGHRREYGFSGETDSLGRYFANDPARPYLVPALVANEQAVLQLIEEAVNAAAGSV